METFNAIMKALIFIVMTGAAAIAMFVAACYFTAVHVPVE